MRERQTETERERETEREKGARELRIHNFITLELRF